jgi:hypothetical protein
VPLHGFGESHQPQISLDMKDEPNPFQTDWNRPYLLPSIELQSDGLFKPSDGISQKDGNRLIVEYVVYRRTSWERDASPNGKPHSG